MSAADGLGFAGLLAEGRTPREAWEIVRDRCREPSVRAVLEAMQHTAAGRAALEQSRQAWTAHGLPAPWDDSPGADS